MTSKKKLVEFFYDVVSPYTWLAFEVLCRYRSHWNIELKLKPFYLGGIMQGSGNKPPATVANKAVYMMTDLERLARYFDVPLRPPQIKKLFKCEIHLKLKREKDEAYQEGKKKTWNPWEVMVTKGTLKTQRFITAVDMKQPEFTEQLSRELWRRIYVEDVDATEPENLKQAALKAGMSEAIISDALSRMTKEEVKNRLKLFTQEALDLGAFGAPFIVVHMNGKKEIFFGSDRFPVMAMVIGEQWKGPLPGVASHL